MAIMHDDGSMDNRGFCYLLFCFLVDTGVLINPAYHCFFAYLRARDLFCGDTAVAWMPPMALLAIQAASSMFAFIILGPPVAEIVSAAPGYFQGLKDLMGCRVYKLVLLHLLFEACIFAATIRGIIFLAGETCNPDAIVELRGLLSAQAPSLFVRSVFYLLFPAIRKCIERRQRIRVAPALVRDGEELALGSDTGTPSDNMTPEQRAKAERELALAKARLTLDVNWHETNSAWTERRRMKKGLVEVEDTNGLARKRLDEVTTKLGLPLIKGKKPGKASKKSSSSSSSSSGGGGESKTAEGLRKAAASGALALKAAQSMAPPKAATLELTAGGKVKLRREPLPSASSGVLAAINTRARVGAAKQLPPLEQPPSR